jgi:hypothetical protein
MSLASKNNGKKKSAKRQFLKAVAAGVAGAAVGALVGRASAQSGSAVTLESDGITLPPLTGDPTLESGKLFFRSDLGRLRLAISDSAVKNILTDEDPINLAQISGTALTARDWSLDLAKLQNIDVELSVLVTLLRWGRNVSPAWVHGAEVTAPAEGSALVSKTVTTGKNGFIYGFFISAGEANDFKVNWRSGSVNYSRRVVFAGKGSLQYVGFVPLNEGLPAAGGSSITITNVNAGSTGIVYQAAILYAEM